MTADRIRPIPRLAKLDAYEGCWVAVTDGEVIAAAESSHKLALDLLALDTRKSSRAVIEYVRKGSDAFVVGVG